MRGALERSGMTKGGSRQPLHAGRCGAGRTARFFRVFRRRARPSPCAELPAFNPHGGTDVYGFASSRRLGFYGRLFAHAMGRNTRVRLRWDTAFHRHNPEPHPNRCMSQENGGAR